MPKETQTGLFLLLACLGLIALPFGRAPAPEAKGQAKEASPLRKGEGPSSVQPGLPGDLCQQLGLSAQCLYQASRGHVLPVIVTLPDPQTSGLPLYFDEALDALDSSIEAAGLRRQQFWLPPAWSNQDARAAPGVGQAPNEPGWMVYRDLRPQCGATTLVLLLVGESPLSGLDAPMFRSALDWAKRLGGGNYRVLGPFFSGSALTLWDELPGSEKSNKPLCKENTLELLCTEKRKLRVVSGSATGDVGVPSHINFETMVVPDAAMLAFVLQELVAAHQIAAHDEPLRVAVLSESSAYGALALPDREHVKLGTFRFPPHLAQLRSAHAAKASDKNDQAPVAHPTLGLSLQRGARPASDALPNLSALRPHTTELSLRSTLREIARRDFRYLILVATDPLDLMYLAQEARTYCPRVRLVTLGAHALYTHPELRRDFAGMLVGTSYPLLLESQAWQRSQGRRDGTTKSFSNDSAQGIYNAMQRLLSESLATPFAPLDRDAYPAPAVRVVGPARWLTEVYNGHFWPLRVQGTQNDQKVSRPVRSHSLARASSFLSGLSFLWCAVAAIHVVLLFVGRSWVQVPIVRVFAPSVWQLPSSGQQYWIASHLVHAFSGCAIALVTYRVQCNSTLIAVLIPIFTFVFTAILAVAGVFVLGAVLAGSLRALLAGQREPACDRRPSRGDQDDDDNEDNTAGFFARVKGATFGRVSAFWREMQPREPYPAVVSLLVSLWMGGLSYFALQFLRGLSDDLWSPRGRLLVTRLVDPLGMCGLWPILLLSAGLYLWGVFGLARTAAIQRFPSKTPFPDGEASAPGPRLSDVTLQHPDAFRRRIWGFEIVAASLCVIMSWLVATTLLPSFEWQGFDSLLTCTLCTLAATVLFAGLHGTILWNQLRHLLVRLAASPMVDAYDRIGTKIAGSFGLSLRSHVPNADELSVSLRSLQLLIATARRSPTQAAISNAAPALAEIAQQLSESLGSHFTGMGEPVSDASDPTRSGKIHGLFFAAARTLSETLSQLWYERNDKMKLEEFDDIARPDKLLPGGIGDAPTAQLLANVGPASVRLWTRAAEDFVAMRNATFVYHSIDQIRRCLGFALVGALALMFAVFSYPLHPLRFTATWGALLLLCTVAAASRVIIAMEGNELLRRLARTNSERSTLNANFVQQVLVYVVMPLLLLFSRAFPDVSDALATFLQPLWSGLQ